MKEIKLLYLYIIAPKKKGLVMSLTVKDLFQYDSNFDPAKIRRLTGKSDYKKTGSSLGGGTFR